MELAIFVLVEAMFVVERLIAAPQRNIAMGMLDVAIWTDIQRVNIGEVNKRFDL